jgi:outer membrane lipoprotein SlyB
MRTTWWLAAIASLLFCASGRAADRYGPPPFPSRADAQYCSAYARDYTRWQGDRGGGVEGAVGGAVRGAILGGIVDGSDGARRGARAGGAIGGIRGAREQRRDNAWLYQRAYDDCMYHQRRY